MHQTAIPLRAIAAGDAQRLASHRSKGAVMAEKKASTDYPIHELLAERWSPYAFDERQVQEADLRSLFEAARWAPSSYNEQPGSYILATKNNPDQFQRLLSCLDDGKQVWAKAAPVLALGVVSLRFARNAEANLAAVHDLGLAAGNLLLEATAWSVRALCPRIWTCNLAKCSDWCISAPSSPTQPG
jgi:Nitroreductase family